MADRPPHQPRSGPPVSPEAVETKLDALRQEVAALPELVGERIESSRRLAALSLWGVGVGAVLVVLALCVAQVFTPEELRVERNLWNVATDAEREQIREILLRSSAPLSLVYELTGELPPRLLVERPPAPPVVVEPASPLVDPPRRLVDPPLAVPIPVPMPDPCLEEPPPPSTHPFAETP